MAEYLACGNVMSDRIALQDGTYSDWHMGGPGFFALSGIRLWTPSCKLVAQTGADYGKDYGLWMDRNQVSNESVWVEDDEVPRYTLRYNDETGAYQSICENSLIPLETRGYLKAHPYHIDQAASPETKAVYVAQHVSDTLWRNINQVKEKWGLKVMWEIAYPISIMDSTGYMDKLRSVAYVPDMWSVNLNEASHMMNIPRENIDDIINEIMKLPFELTLFRIGKKGSYTITPTNAYFCESIDIGATVDPTGCGNNSTGAAMYAHVEGHDPLMVAIMANISAGYNASTYGTFDLYTPEVMQHARTLAQQIYLEKTSKDVSACQKEGL